MDTHFIIFLANTTNDNLDKISSICERGCQLYPYSAKIANVNGFLHSFFASETEEEFRKTLVKNFSVKGDYPYGNKAPFNAIANRLVTESNAALALLMEYLHLSNYQIFSTSSDYSTTYDEEIAKARNIANIALCFALCDRTKTQIPSHLGL